MSILQSNNGMTLADFLGRGWTEASIRTNSFISSNNINRKYLKYGGYAAAGVGGLIAAGSMVGSYGRHGTIANVYTGLSSVAGGVSAGMFARKAKMGGLGIAGSVALGAFGTDRMTRFQENHPIVGTLGIAGALAGGSFAYEKYKPAIESTFRRWANQRAGSLAKGALNAMRMI